MKQVIVPPGVSYLVLGIGALIALSLWWKAYEVAIYLHESEAVEAAYYDLTY